MELGERVYLSPVREAEQERPHMLLLLNPPKSGLGVLLGIAVSSPSQRMNESLGKLFSSTCECWSGARCWGEVLGREGERGADGLGGQ